MLGKDARAMIVSGNTLPCFTEADTDKNSLQKVLIKAESNLAWGELYHCIWLDLGRLEMKLHCVEFYF